MKRITQVGIEDYLQMEFEYDKAIYHLKDAIVGKVIETIANYP